MSPRVPLSVRRGVREPFAVEGGVPSHLRGELRGWLSDVLTHTRVYGPDDATTRRLATILHVYVAANWSPFGPLMTALEADEDLYLDAIDHALDLASTSQVQRLNALLESATSVWRARADGSDWSLEETVTPEARVQYQNALTSGGEIADDLSEAWRKAFGRDADGSDAWQHAVRAIEGALWHVVIPKASRAQLGKIIEAIRARPEKWIFEISAGDYPGDGAGILPALELVGYDPARHPNGEPPPEIEPARAVVHLATTIVEWVRSGAFRQHPEKWPAS